MKIIEMQVDDLHVYENNPRDNEEAVKYVANSIKEFGFKVPIIIDKANVIVAGHTRLKAAQQLGLEKVPCIVADDLDDDQIKAFRLADNKVSEASSWDWSKLEQELDDLSIADFDMSEFGFELSEIDDTDGCCEIVEDDCEFEPSKEPMSKIGDIYVLGEHRLMCGDSTQSDNLAALMGEDKADLYITDPPYNVGYVGGTKGHLTIANDNMDDKQFRHFLSNAFKAANQNMKPGAAFYIWHAGSEGYNFIGACRDVGWKVRQCLIWNKNQFVLGRQDFQWKHEPCLYGWSEGVHHWYSDRKQSTVIDMNKPLTSAEHPTMKPIELFAYQIKCSSQVGDIVLDSFGGSGTTIMACEQLRRKARCMELDPRYIDVIIKRWEEFTGKKAVKITV